MAKRRFKKGKKAIPSKKTEVDGFKFDSTLEKYCYEKLRDAGLFDKYATEKFQLLEGFKLDQQCWERQTNSKGDFMDRSDKKVLGISYTPDFTSHDYIIEVKGYPNPTFNYRWKMFKNLIKTTGDERLIFKPQTRKECEKVVEVILEHRNTL